ncbi:MAG: LacI family DNA-binding transcriptional regulator [Paracoccaceae bacterium]|nr:MAG: LacI family DNA-binding transcriptional regulator [Paracoccaceae bacterium]
MADGGTTLKALAAELGISPATVSRALAGNPRISDETRKRVAAAARAAGYVPNRAAQSLVSGRASGFAGLVLQDPGYGREPSYLGEFVQGLGQGLAERGIDLFLSFIPNGQSELAIIRNIVTTRRADGLVLARTSEVDPRVDWLLGNGFPFVTHGRTGAETGAFDWIDTDGEAAFARAFDLLYGLGHRRFGLVTIEEPMAFRRHRTEGLANALARAGDAELRVATSPRHDAQRRREVIRDLLGRPDRPTAILCLFDSLALAVLEEAAEMGFSVPRDLSVIGFDNIAAAAHARPALTTFDSDTLAAAHALADMLADRITRPAAPPRHRLITPRLVLRHSHGPVPD